jgi:hypothetical protein
MSTSLGVVFLQQIGAVFFGNHHLTGRKVLIQSFYQSLGILSLA